VIHVRKCCVLQPFGQGSIAPAQNRRSLCIGGNLSPVTARSFNHAHVKLIEEQADGAGTTTDYFHHLIYAWSPIGEFDEIYDILRNEKPITASYWAETDAAFNPFTPSKSSQIRRVRIGTGSESVGEGSEDESGGFAAMMAALAPDLTIAQDHIGQRGKK
jgi:hypothetical protein